MENSLSTYLFRTISFKPKGLKLRLKIATVSRRVETFDEKEFPAATILSHGLFLAKPTPAGVKDPALFAVLNQESLNDDLEPARFTVYCREQLQSDIDGSFDDDGGDMRAHLHEKRLPPKDAGLSGNRTLLRIALIRYGIVKEFPNPVRFEDRSTTDYQFYDNQVLRSAIYPLYVGDGLVSACVDHHPDTENTNTRPALEPYPIPSSEIFVASMRFILEKYFLQDVDSPEDAMVAPSTESKPQESQENSPSHMLNRDLLRVSLSFDWMLESHFSSLEHWSSLLESNIAQDSEIHCADWDETHKQMRSLVSACLELLLRPLAQIFEGKQHGGISEIRKGHIENSLLGCIQILQRFERGTKTELAQSNWYGKSKYERSVVHAALEVGACWKSITLRRIIRSHIVNGLSRFHTPKQIDHTVSHILAGEQVATPEWLARLIDSVVKKKVRRVADQFLAEQSMYPNCQKLAVRSNSRVNFGPTFDEIHPLEIVAMMLYHQTTICVLTVGAEQTESTGEEIKPSQTSKICVKLFRNTAEIASYELDLCIGSARSLYQKRANTHHFTGRYLINLDCNKYQLVQQLYCLDLAPCVQQEPESPVVSIQNLSHWMAAATINYNCLSFTDRFLAYLQVSIPPPP